MFKYIVNGFPYLGKNENRTPSQALGEFVVFKLIEPYSMMAIFLQVCHWNINY